MESKQSGWELFEVKVDGPDAKGDREEEEDDHVAFVVSPSIAVAHNRGHDCKSVGQGLQLDTRLASRLITGSTGTCEHERARDESQRQERAPVTVVFDLPDGSQADQEFQRGQTVEVLKSFVESEFGIPMSCQELYLGSTLMMDPMSLLDYGEADDQGELCVVVEGDMSAEAKK